MCTHPLPISSNRWHQAAGRPVRGVLAWPFRAHLLHVAEALDLPWRAVALVAGLDSVAANRIIGSRPRRGLMPASQAAAVGAGDAARLWRHLALGTDATHTRQMLVALRAAGVPLERQAHFLGLSRPETTALIDGSSARCALRTELLAGAALQALGIGCPSAPSGTAARRPALPAVA